MRPIASSLLATLIVAGCSQADTLNTREVDLSKNRLATHKVKERKDGSAVSRDERESPVDYKVAAELSNEFGLTSCSGVTRLRDVRANGYLAESWRVREGNQCFEDFSNRAARYFIYEHLDVSQAERDQLPWLCHETGAHVTRCENQGSNVTLLIESPRDADFIVLRRLTKVAG